MTASLTALPLSAEIEITSITLEEEMKRSYLDYAMSVIVSRALPDVRDGLKPVHRRILYAMHEGGNGADRPLRKCANAIGNVMMSYHPHGDSSIYEAIVRMAQDFSMRLPLIEGQGNFGSMDGDPAAAYRYTESRLSKVAHCLLEDIDQDTVDFVPNFDNATEEPIVLPARYPNLLVNGANGIAVGMATNIPPHNLGEVIDACCAFIDNPDITLNEILAIVPGPDFPTGGIIVGRRGILEAAQTGRGSIIMRGRTHFEEIRKDRQAIIVTEIPYQVNKARMIERMAEMVKLKLIEGIADLRDESDREGVRVVIELKRDATPDVVLNQLYKHTSLQTSFGVNSLALDKGQPRLMNILTILKLFVQFRENAVTRRIKYELRKARNRAHILIGLAVAVTNIDEMVALIKKASDAATAKEQIMGRPWPAAMIQPLINLVADKKFQAQDRTYTFSETQTKAILDLRLHRLTGLERHKISDELHSIVTEIEDFLSLLASRSKLMGIIRTEMQAIKQQFSNPRRTTIEDIEGQFDLEDLIQREEMVITVSRNGYIKRVPLNAYRAQRRGGKGRSGMSMRTEDMVKDVFVTDTHTPVLFFSTKGIAYLMKVHRLSESSPQSLGKPMINLLPLAQDEVISTVLPLPKDQTALEQTSIVFATSHGTVRRNNLSVFLNVRAKGKLAMNLENEEKLIGVVQCLPGQDLFLSSRSGRCVRFPLDSLRIFDSRNSLGVRGIRLLAQDQMISITVLNHIKATVEERAAYLKMTRIQQEAETASDSEESFETDSDEEGNIVPEISDFEESSETDSDEEGNIVPEILDSEESFETDSDEEGNIVPEISDSEESSETDSDEEGNTVPEITLSMERYKELAAQEQFILTISENGFGKRTSAYEFRSTGRGIRGVGNMRVNAKTGPIVNNFVVDPQDQIILVTNGGKLIRCPVHDIRMVGRQSQLVRVLRVAEGERVVSVARIPGNILGEDEELNQEETTSIAPMSSFKENEANSQQESFVEN